MLHKVVNVDDLEKAAEGDEAMAMEERVFLYVGA